MRATIIKQKIMKRIFTLAAVLFMTASVWAQSPEKMSYQAVIRNSTDALVTTQGIGMQISILQNTATGTAVYVETQSPTSNANGLVSLEIGTGTVVSGTFASIDWANGLYFIKTETDPTGGTTYTITGTNQLMSVPYALHAKTVENITEIDPVFGASVANGITAADTINWNNHTIDTDTQLDSTGVATLGYVAGLSGSIITYAGSNLPTGYLLCDGSAVSRTTYANLFAAIGISWGTGDGITTFNLPDLRGRFLRGVDAGSGRDPNSATRTSTNGGNSGDNVGSLQTDEYKSHAHDMPTSTILMDAGSSLGTYIQTGTTPTSAAGGAETRPINAYVSYLIQY
ncbi:MAG: microcystin-dependent protein [Vicingaceae bacterium]|jgi:microcystin-dependent protein